MPDVFDPLSLVLRLIGAFYAFAGLVAGRAALTAGLLDAALAGITGRSPSARERNLTWWLTASAWLIFAGGVLLMILAREAMWLFIIGALTQAFYLTVAAPYYFDLDDPPDAKGRRQTTNAFFIYFIATLVVIWASGRYLMPWSALHPALVWPAAAASILFAGYLVWHTVAATRIPKKNLMDGLGLDDEMPMADDTLPPKPFDPRMLRVALSRDYGTSPLKNQKTGSDISLDAFGLSERLKSDLGDWFRDGDPTMQGLAHDLSQRLALECPTIAVAEPGIPNAYFNISIQSPYENRVTQGPNWDRMTAIKIMCDYHCMPVWAANEGAVGNIPPNVLGISGALEDALLDWQDRYDGFLNADDPAQPNGTDEDFAAHERQGLQLAQRVKTERPDLMVYVQTNRGVLVARAGTPPEDWTIHNDAT